MAKASEKKSCSYQRYSDASFRTAFSCKPLIDVGTGCAKQDVMRLIEKLEKSATMHQLALTRTQTCEFRICLQAVLPDESRIG